MDEEGSESGFLTLEFLVAMAFLGILMGMLAPAVRVRGEAARHPGAGMTPSQPGPRGSGAATGGVPAMDDWVSHGGSAPITARVDAAL